MKKLLIVISVLATTLGVRSQSYVGYFSDNYSGVQGLLYNPANVVDSPFKFDINLISASAFGSNDYYGVKFTDLFKNGYDFETQAKKFPLENNNAYVNFDVQGLSVMFNIAPKHSLGFFTRARAVVNANDLNGKLYSELENDFDSTVDYTINEGNHNMVGNSWAEVGLTYGTILIDKDQHFLKGGITAKYLQGMANTYSQGKNVNVVYNAQPLIINNTVTASGEVIYGGTDDFEKAAKDFDFNSKSRGFGADVGFVYEWRPSTVDPNNFNKYKVKFGLSVTDIGSLKFKNDQMRKYVFNNVTVNASTLNGKSYEEILQTFDATPDVVSSEKAVLPTSLHANADWNFYKKFFINLNGDFGLTTKNSLNENFNPTIVTLTPRYESKWYGVYLPLNYSDYRDFQAGIGFRAGPVFVGSGSVITNLISDESKGFDIHAGLKIPFYKDASPRIKDRDADGVVDKEDACPDVAGPASNKGCPVKDKDSDRDGILDKDDKCPSEAGPKENKGCPWEDSDKDGVLDKDDKCPTVFGPKENTGCPWPDTDDDGILDKDDKCPEVKGTKANNGCPEISEAVIKRLNDYAKTILFNSAKSTFQQQTYPILQSIVAILKEYPASNFSLEGHTDSDGATAANQTLSENRAAAVKNYLVENGIDSRRLVSVGFGESKPIATNKTKAGKAQNRRVEVKLTK